MLSGSFQWSLAENILNPSIATTLLMIQIGPYPLEQISPPSTENN
jgi:hypothetical protein